MEQIVTIGTQVAILLGYVFTALYQSKRIKAVEDNFKSQTDLLKNQSDTIKTFEDYKKMINLSDLEKNIQLKLDNQALDFEKNWKGREKEMIEAMLTTYRQVWEREQPKFMRAWGESINVLAQFIERQYPDYSQKKERDESIQVNFPFNAEYLIGYIDSWQTGGVKNSENYLKNMPSSDNTQSEKENPSRQG